MNRERKGGRGWGRRPGPLIKHREPRLSILNILPAPTMPLITSCIGSMVPSVDVRDRTGNMYIRTTHGTSTTMECRNPVTNVLFSTGLSVEFIREGNHAGASPTFRTILRLTAIFHLPQMAPLLLYKDLPHPQHN